MTKPLNPEIKALRAIDRALRPLSPPAQERTVDFFHAAIHNTTQDRVRAALEAHAVASPAEPADGIGTGELP